MASPPPLPWAVRVQPEKLILLCSAAAAIIGAGLVLASLHGSLGLGCAWKACTGVPCVGCGGTRAVALLASGEWLAALRLNPGVVAAVLLLIAINFYAVAVLIGRLSPWRPVWIARLRWRWIVAGVLLGNWLYLLATRAA